MIMTDFQISAVGTETYISKRFEVVSSAILRCRCHGPVETGPTVYIGGYDPVA